MSDFPLTFPVKILLLGAGELGKELTISLQRLGCQVVACDSYAGAPAMQVATSHRVLDMTDAEALEAVIAAERPDLIVPEVEKLASSPLVAAAGEGTRVVPSSRVVELTFDRQGIRTLAATAANVPTSPFAFADSLAALQEGAEKVGFPCFVKPTMSSSGHGQSRVERAEDLPAAWREACSGARADTGRVIVEGEIAFDYEITLLSVRHLDPADPMQVRTSFCAPIGHRQSSGDYVESWQPQAMKPEILKKAQVTAQKVLDALAADTARAAAASGKSANADAENPMLGIFGVEMFVKGEDVYFSELSPRPHDTGMVTMITQPQNEFDLHARAILGLPVDTSMFPDASAGASVPLKSPVESDQPCYTGLGAALQVSPDAQLRIFGKPVAHEGRRMAVALATGADTDQARAKAHEVIGKITIH
ncbi:formate-dependent phosphoribosylglycinamide formyltransferase [Mobiluncus sp.]|uniref:formate-dependent phosphoribosylglycinamide formyltransferase n=1 Tax=Mobiluncus sp. TaxID=47293 RepID=UPI002A90BC8D|nr:formate-dependent phosphoribosylglycinamide formyltransferase [Mobiluncus sp.]MDY6077465.1 formate-dependent phosphoribosylglycinamide formyltransferase [Mobiluncus sp.]